MKKTFSFGIVVSLMTGLFAFGLVPSSQARERYREHWHEGRWVHDRHGGRLGWWWVVDGAWHFYAHPVSNSEQFIVVREAPAYPAPVQTVIVQAPPPPVQAVVAQPAPAPAPEPVLYYCKATGTYYPETMTCPGGWSNVSAGKPPTP